MKYIIANLKMNILSSLEREQYFKNLAKELEGKNFEKTKLIFCPPVIHLEAFKKNLPEGCEVGAQNVFWERSGSYTGEISPSMVKNFGGEYVILGHSERRKYLGEKDEEISLKIEAALKVGLKPILCVGEGENEKIMSANVIFKKLEKCLEKVNRAKIENIIICYEPVWAISSNRPNHLPTTDEIMSARLVIKKFLVKKYGPKTAEKVGIIYGGSVSPTTAIETCVDPGMQGALIGKSSLTPYEFVKIAEVLNG